MDDQLKNKHIKVLIPTRMHFKYSVSSSFLLKYSPKYCKTVDLLFKNCNNGPILSKIKTAKKIESIFSRNMKKLTFELFKNKRRFVKDIWTGDPKFLRYFPNIPNYFLNIEWKLQVRGFFLLRNIKSLTISPQIDLTQKKYSEVFTWRFWRHLKSLTQLKHLKVVTYSKFDQVSYEFLVNLDSVYSDIVTSLQSFELDLNLTKNCEVPLEKSLYFPKLFKYASDLRVFYDLNYFQNGFSRTINNFTSITHLTINLYKPKISHLNFFIFPNIRPKASGFENSNIEASNFNVLSKLDKLQSLDIELSLDSEPGFKKFLENIALPSSLKRICLNLQDINWSYLFPNTPRQDYDSENPFENDPWYAEFYNKWSQLKVLQVLRICFYDGREIPISSAYFVFPILKRLNNLVEFICHSTYKRQVKKNFKSLDLSRLLEGIAHLKPTLREIIIDDYEISLRNLSPDSLSPFPNLKTLSLGGTILGDTKAGMLVGLFQESEQKPLFNYELKLDKVIIESKDTFQTFLKSFKKNAYKTSIDIKISIDVDEFRLYSLYESLVYFIRQGYKIPNLELCMRNPYRDFVDWTELNVLLKEHRTFKSFGLNFFDMIDSDSSSLGSEKSDIYVTGPRNYIEDRK